MTPLPAVFEAIQLGIDACAFDIGEFNRAGQTPGLRRATLLMLVLAGVSRTLGNAVILSLNQVPARRYVAVISIEALVFAAGVIVTALCAALAGWILSDETVPGWDVFWVIALAQAPQLLGMLILMPYAGEFIDRLLRFWSMALVIFGLHFGLGLSVLLSASAALLGWLTVRILTILLGGRVTRAVAYLRRLAAGRDMIFTASGARIRSAGRGER